jgi:hypothetical protein
MSTGLPFSVAYAHHIKNTYHASRAYAIVSSSISKTANYEKLQAALGEMIVAVWKDIKPHTRWEDMLKSFRKCGRQNQISSSHLVPARSLMEQK